MAKEIPWNWAKFLISADGQILKYYNPRIDPLGVIKDIQQYLDTGTLSDPRASVKSVTKS
jgi:glutathione peroxidase-family protein